MRDLVQDMQYAVRSLRHAPGFTTVAVLTLAIGVGATTALFSAVNATMLRPLPYAHPEQLVSVRSRLSNGQLTTGLLSPLNLGLLKEPLPVERAAGFGPSPQEITFVDASGSPTNLLITGVGEGFFETLGVPLVIGPGFSHEDHLPGAGPAQAVGILSHRIWTTMFARDPSIAGRILRTVEIPTGIRVAGVAAPEIDLPRGTDLWLSARNNPHDFGHGLDVVLRAKAGANIDTLRERADVLLAEQARTSPTDVNRLFVMRPLATAIVGDLGPMLVLVLGATGLLLLLACVNVMNLLLARGAGRARELAVRTALGASRAQLIRQMLSESFVLAVAGSAAGLLLGYAAMRLLLVFGGSTMPRLDSVPVDTRVLLFTAGVLVFSALVMGLAPAWRLATVDMRTLMNESGRSASPGRATSRSMSALIIVEVALAIVLTAGAGWLVQSFVRLGAVNPGFTPQGRLVMTVRAGRTFNFRKPDEVATWSNEVIRRVRDVPGVALAGGAATFPLMPNRDGTVIVGVQGETWDPAQPNNANSRIVSTGFFEAMGVKLVAGRLFDTGDRRDARPVAIVNQTFARMFLNGRDPLASSFAAGLPAPDPKSMRDIVGVIDDMPYESLALAPRPAFYIVQEQSFPLIRPTVVISPRSGDPRALESSVRATLTAFDPLIMLSFTTAPEILASTLAGQRLGMTLMLIFGCLALLLGSIGIYGVIAYASTQRREEFATRIALGASAGRVFRLVLAGGQRLTAIGVVLGLIGAYGGGRLAGNRIYAMRAADPLVLIAATLIVALVAVIATMIPALRASRTDPIRALRPE